MIGRCSTYTKAGGEVNVAMIVRRDDTKQQGSIVISMTNDWIQIFSFER